MIHNICCGHMYYWTKNINHMAMMRKVSWNLKYYLCLVQFMSVVIRLQHCMRLYVMCLSGLELQHLAFVWTCTSMNYSYHKLVSSYQLFFLCRWKKWLLVSKHYPHFYSVSPHTQWDTLVHKKAKLLAVPNNQVHSYLFYSLFFLWQWISQFCWTMHICGWRDWWTINICGACVKSFCIMKIVHVVYCIGTFLVE